jgi:hypothetical protein
MTLQSQAQALYVIDPQSPISPASVLPSHDEHSVSAIPPHHEHEGKEQLMSGIPLEVTEPVDIEIVVEELPGAPPGTKDPEPELEVSDEPLHVEDANDAKKSDKDGKGVKNEKWDWSKHGPKGFVTWIKERLAAVPKHSGYDSAGLERAMAYMEKLDSEISKAMRMDLDEELDANQVEKVRAQLDDGLSRLQGRLDKVKDSKKSSKKRKKSASDLQSEINTVLQRYSDEDLQSYVADTSVPGEEWTAEKCIVQIANNGEEPGFEGFGMVKEAQKIMGVTGLVITVPILISRIARVCINGTVSAGHDIEDLYKRQVDRWKLTEREQAEVQQLLFDMGYPLRQDRGFMPGDDLEVWDTDNMDWAANYRT